MNLKVEYLGEMKGNNNSNVYTKKLYGFWNNGYNKRKTCPLFCTSIRANLSTYVRMIFFSLIGGFLEFTSVYFFREYIKSFQNDWKDSFSLGRTNVGIIFAISKLLSAFINRQTSFYQIKIGFKIAAELNCFIFDKVLKASPSSMKEKSNEGEIVNFLQVDSMKLINTMTSSPNILIIPFQLIVYSIMLFDSMKYSFLFGFLALAIFLGFNMYNNMRMRKIQNEMCMRKDDRMRVTTEAINTIKVLKLYAWEEEFLKRITEARTEEMKKYRDLFCVSNVNLFLLWLAPVAVSVVTLGAYQSYTDHLNIADIFTALAIFNIIQEPIRNLPMIISNMLETFVSLKRIEAYLEQEDIKPEYLVKNTSKLIEKNISIKITGDYSWGIEVDDGSDIIFIIRIRD
jgi:ABC-type multidrug transport system fused ATPase/permease subunit